MIYIAQRRHVVGEWVLTSGLLGEQKLADIFQKPYKYHRYRHIHIGIDTYRNTSATIHQLSN